MSLPKEKAWFPAKKYGYGWGLPSRWQGWCVFIGYLLGILIPSLFLRSPGRIPVYLVFVALLSVALVAICRWKGEAPHWHRGGGDEKSDASEPLGAPLKRGGENRG